MSRTVRRKHRRWVWIPGGYKIAGEYTKYDWDPEVGYTYREPTPEERFRRYKWLHLDHGPNDVTPGHWFRNNRMRENRAINKQEIHRWMKNPDNYEPLFEEEPRSCYWDWS